MSDRSVFLAGCLCLVLAGCTTPSGKSISQQPVALGKQIYFSKCTTCHTAQPVRNYSDARWVHILDEMAPKAELSPAEKIAVLAYVQSLAPVQ